MSDYSPDGTILARWGQTEALNSSLVTSWGWNEWATISENIRLDLDEVVDRLIQQLKTPNTMALALALVTPLKEIGVTIAAMHEVRNLDLATANQLDLCGAIVGVPRDGQNDDDYRMLIKLWIFLSSSNGEPEVIIAAAKLFTRATRVWYYEDWPAKVIIQYTSQYPPPKNLHKMLKSLMLGGVGLALYWSTNDGPDFAFDGEGIFDPEPNTLGFGEIGYPLEGGKFVEQIL